MTEPADKTAPSPAIASFLAGQGLAGQMLVPLATDASARRYFRLPGRGLLLMEDRHDPAAFAGFVLLSGHLRALGLSAPDVRATDAANGLALIEDFGHATYRHCLAAGQEEPMLYQLAVDTLLQLHNDPHGAAVARPRYRIDLHLDEIGWFSDWFAPAVAPPGFDKTGFAARFRQLWARALAPLQDQFSTLVLRDFHIDNLMYLPERAAVARCGLLDFQDGVIGPCEYDLLSLLQDARRDLAPGLEAAMLARYIAGAPAHLGGAAGVTRRYHLLAADRHTRILGNFVRLDQRDGKPQYLSLIHI